MLRYATGAASVFLFLLAGFFLWKSQAAADNPVPKAPKALAALTSDPPPAGEADDGRATAPPAATEKSKEEKRFARADKDKDGKITLEELYLPRRKAFARLDTNADGRLAFEEWSASTAEKFADADTDKSAGLSPREFETTKPKTKPKPKICAC
ncbi:EF-hand domain-containing protein [Sphingosinicella sp. BN140058]|uniref:EF-hand domain-containing protein n=1 Tax=Sphingosinicella sp. BN140058 TaxID=1892855 RepID=UPI001010DA6B|nr:EF-hand domain-containing protein [Sphingosinicella sp. BN140058]QAY79362.1 histidine kinase [Sphingosinicella sp. BN140058]